MKKNRVLGPDEVESELKSLIVDIARCRVTHIKRDARVREDLGLDSFTALEILVAVENKFSLKIAESELDQFVTFGDVADYIFKRLVSKVKNGSSSFL